MRKYRYVTFAGRKQIAAWYQAGGRPADMAERLGMSTKAIYLELKRGEPMDDIVSGRYKIFEINEALFQYDQPPLGT